MFSSRFTICLFFLILLGGIAFGQPNTVQLKDGNGNLISSHPSITAAYNAIPAVISQAYLIEILNDYNGTSEIFPIQITSRTGSSNANTITLRPAAGNSGEIITKALNNNPIINLDKVNYFILDGRPGGIGDTANLVIENTLNVGAKTNTINFNEGASNNVVKYVIAKSIPRSNAGPRNIHFNSSNFGNSSNNIIEFCEVVGGRSGISFSAISSGVNSGNIIRNTKIYNFGLTGFWFVSAVENTTIRDCEIYQQESGLDISMAGGILMNPSAASGTTEIINNKIYNLKHNSYLDSAAVWGIQVCGADGATLNIYNNFIALPFDNQNTNSTHGILLYDSSAYTCNVFYNSVRIGGIQSGSISELEVLSSGITKSNNNPASVFNVINNIFINTRTGGTGSHVGGYVQSTEGTLNFDYNCYFSESNQPAYHVVWGNLFFNSLLDYRNAAFPNEQNSIFKDVEFVSDIDLHVTGSSNGDIELAGMPVSITYDIDGDIRDPYLPYKGADEADILPVELSAFIYAVSGNTVTLKWITKTEVNNAGFELQRRSENGNWVTVAFINGAGTSTYEHTYSYVDENLSAGIYNYRLKQVDMGGSSTLYNLSQSVEILNPDQYSLSQNYPNPFNPNTVIEYSLPAAGQVNITIYNITGEEVASLVNTVQEAGNYKINFNGGSLASGTYVYRIQVNDFVSVKKMTLLR